jgi:hypothetical protein
LYDIGKAQFDSIETDVAAITIELAKITEEERKKNLEFSRLFMKDLEYIVTALKSQNKYTLIEANKMIKKHDVWKAANMADFKV